MKVVVSYDVRTDITGGQRRLRRVAKLCESYGQRVQYSIFECVLDPAQWTLLKNRLIKEIDQEQDSLRFYYLGANWQRRIEHAGLKKHKEVSTETLIL